MKKIGITQKIILLTAVTILLAVSLTGGIGYFMASTTMMNKLKNTDIKNIVEIKASKIEGRLSRAIETSKIFAADPSVLKWFADRETDEKLGQIVKSKLTQLQNNHDYFTSFAVSNRTYHYWAADGKLLDTVSKSDPDDSWFFKSVSQKKKFEINIDYNKELGETGVFLNVLVGDVNDPHAVAGVGFRLDELIKELFKSQEGYDDVTMLLDNDGTILISMTKEDIGKKITEVFPESAAKQILSDNGGAEVIEYKDLKTEKKMIMGRIHIKSSGLVVINQMPVRTLLKSFDRIAFATLISAVLSIIVFIFIFIFLGNVIFKQPVIKIMNFVDMLSMGNLTAELEYSNHDEIGYIVGKLKKLQNKISEIINAAMVSSSQLASSAEELAATSSNLAEGAQNQAAAVEEATASLEEISASNESIAGSSKIQSDHSKETYKAMEELGVIVKSVNADATSALNVANQTAEEAIKGGNLMQNTIAGMNSIEENSRKIAEMISMISEISDKVNLLALNAAIEAARAGDHGRGFAVVADEIGKLAEQTAESAKSITLLVSNGVKSAEQGIKDIDETSRALEKIISYITNTKELVQKIANSTDVQARSSVQVLKATGQVMEMSDSISNSTEEQTITHMEISKTMEQINEQTQSQASGAEQIAASAEEISSQAESMKSILEFFKV